MGDVVGITDATGSVIASYSYGEWGECTVDVSSTNTTVANLNPLRYRGYYYDTETGYYYLQSRYYDPNICRFINADDIAYLDIDTIGCLNLFAYCCNDPINHNDSNGFAASNIDKNVKISDFIKKYKLKQNAFNCFSYAIGVYDRHCQIPNFNYHSTINECKKKYYQLSKKTPIQS